MQRIGNAFPLFLDSQGLLLDGGNIYVGVPDGDPENVPGDRITVYSDFAGTIPLAQPIRTIGGFAVDGVTPVFMFVAETDFSQTITDNIGALVGYSPSVYTDTAAFQPASATLTLLAALTTTAFGRSLLVLANAGALEAVLGGLNYVALAGDTMTGEITRQGAGVVPHWNDPAMVAGKIFITDAGDPDPTVDVGDIWLVRA